MRIIDWRSDVCSSDLGRKAWGFVSRSRPATGAAIIANLSELASSRMTTPVSELIELLSLERLEDNLFRGQSRDIGTKYVFGGQVVGQALSAAQATLKETRTAHSLHAYFLKARSEEHTSELQSLMRISYAVFCL